MRRSHLDRDNEILLPDSLGPMSGTNVLDTINKNNNSLHGTTSDQKGEMRNTTDLARENSHQPPILLQATSFNDTTLTAISGAIAGFLSGIVVCPLDVAKTRLQAQGLQHPNGTPYYKGIFGTMKRIVQDESITGLYKGLTPTLLGYFPTWAIYFPVYEFTKEAYSRSPWTNDFMSHSFSAITAGAISTIITNPIWVVKTRLVLQDNSASCSTRYHGTLDAFKTIWRQESMRAFYTGLIPSLLGLSHVAIHFPVYEYLKTRLNRPNNEGDRNFLHLPNLIIASSLSKMIASALTYPHEILRTRMQLKSDLPASIQHRVLPLVITTFENEGFKGFYSGFAANLLRTVPASAITLVSFEYVRDLLRAN